MSINDAIGPAILGGGGGASLPTADVSDLLAGATANTFVVVDPVGNGALATFASARAALASAWTEIAASDAGWTRTAGAATGAVVSVVSSRLHTEVAGTVNDDFTNGFSGPRHAYTLTSDPTSWEVAARVSFSGLDANGRVNVSVRTASTLVGVTIRSSGSLEIFAGAVLASTSAGSFASGNWIRFSRVGGILSVFSGTGASLSAVTWTFRGSADIQTGALQTVLTSSLGCYTAAPSSPPLTSDVGPIYERSK